MGDTTLSWGCCGRRARLVWQKLCHRSRVTFLSIDTVFISYMQCTYYILDMCHQIIYLYSICFISCKSYLIYLIYQIYQIYQRLYIICCIQSILYMSYSIYYIFIYSTYVSIKHWKIIYCISIWWIVLHCITSHCCTIYIFTSYYVSLGDISLDYIPLYYPIL